MKKKIVMILACLMVIGSIFVMASEVEEVTEVTTQTPEVKYEEVETYVKLLTQTGLSIPGGSYGSTTFNIPYGTNPSYISYYFKNTSSAPVIVELQKQNGSSWSTVSTVTIPAGGDHPIGEYKTPVPIVNYRIKLTRTDGGTVSGNLDVAYY